MNNAEEAFDERYVRFREHANVLERVTALEGHQTQVMAQLNRIELGINARPTVTQQGPQETAAALALHRALDAFDKRPANSGGGNTIITALAIIGAIALGAAAMWLLGHH